MDKDINIWIGDRVFVMNDLKIYYLANALCLSSTGSTVTQIVDLSYAISNASKKSAPGH